MIKNALQWFIYSSKDPQKIALTVKGLVPLVALLGFFDQNLLDSASDSIGEVVVAIGQVLTAGMVVWGLVRKIYLTLTNKSDY